MMFRNVIVAATAMFAMAAPAVAQSAFDGVWKVDIASAQLPDRPMVQSLQNGVYSCSSCVPAYTVPADGQMHKVEGYPYWDEISIRVIDSQTVEIAQSLRERPVGTSQSRVSADNSTVTATWSDTSSPDGTVTSGESTMRRIGAAPSGSHAISGTWGNPSVTRVSDAALIATISLTNTMFSFSVGSGWSYAATLGGPPVPVTGDLAGATAQVRQLPDGSIEETDFINGEATSRMTLTPTNGQSLAIRVEDLKVGTTTSYMAVKQ